MQGDGSQRRNVARCSTMPSRRRSSRSTPPTLRMGSSTSVTSQGAFRRRPRRRARAGDGSSDHTALRTVPTRRDRPEGAGRVTRRTDPRAPAACDARGGPTRDVRVVRNAYLGHQSASLGLLSLGPISTCQSCGSAGLRPALFLGFLPPVNSMRPLGAPAERSPGSRPSCSSARRATWRSSASRSSRRSCSRPDIRTHRFDARLAGELRRACQRGLRPSGWPRGTRRRHRLERRNAPRELSRAGPTCAGIEPTERRNSPASTASGRSRASSARRRRLDWASTAARDS